jgi:hypothetical protein
MLDEKKLQHIFGSFLDEVKLLAWYKLFKKTQLIHNKLLFFLNSFLNMPINIHNMEEL